MKLRSALVPWLLVLVPSVAGADPVNSPFGSPPPVAPGAPGTPPAPPPQTPPPTNFAPPPTVGGAPNGMMAPPPVTAPPPVAAPPPMMVQPPGPPQAPAPTQLRSRSMFFTGLHGAPGIPVSGQVAEFTSVGGGGLLTGGLALPNGFQLQVELGYRTNPALDLSGADVSALYYGVAARYVLLPTGTVHPYVEAGADLFSSLVSTTVGSTTTASTTGTGFSVQAGAGIEAHLSEQFVLDVGARYDQLLSNANGTSPTGGLFSVMLGGAYYY